MITPLLNGRLSDWRFCPPGRRPARNRGIWQRGLERGGTTPPLASSRRTGHDGPRAPAPEKNPRFWVAQPSTTDCSPSCSGRPAGGQKGAFWAFGRGTLNAAHPAGVFLGYSSTRVLEYPSTSPAARSIQVLKRKCFKRIYGKVFEKIPGRRGLRGTLRLRPRRPLGAAWHAAPISTPNPAACVARCDFVHAAPWVRRG